MNCTVIIPNFNHASFLKERIDSVLAQTLAPLEIILLDDASTDSSRDMMESYRDNPAITHIVYNDRNSGSPFKQWKKGILMAAGEWVWIAESDDTADPRFLETASRRLKANPGSGIFYSDSFCRPEGKATARYSRFSEMKNSYFKTERWSNDYQEQGTDEVNGYLKYFCTINNTSAAVFRKDLLLPLLQKLETFIYHGDWYCQLAIAMNSGICYSPEPLNTFRLHENSFLRPSPAQQHKLECFRILDFLYKNDLISEKKELVDFFTLQYLGFGLISNGYRYGKNLFAAYAAINPALSKKVFRSLLWQKLTWKRHKTIF